MLTKKEKIDPDTDRQIGLLTSLQKIYPMSISGDEFQNISDDKSDALKEGKWSSRLWDHIKNSSLMIFHRKSNIRQLCIKLAVTEEKKEERPK